MKNKIQDRQVQSYSAPQETLPADILLIRSLRGGPGRNALYHRR